MSDFESRWTAVESKVLRRCLIVCNGDRSAAEDLRQEVALRAFRGYKSLKDKDLFPGWILKVTRNAGHDFLRKRIADRAVAPLDSLEYELIDQKPTSEHISIRTSDRNWLREAIRGAFGAGRITKKQREVLLAKLNSEDEPWDQIASRLNYKVSDCASAHCRGIVQLRSYLFAHHQESFGGTKRLRAAAEQALRAVGVAAMSAEEYEIFAEIVLKRNHNYHKRGWQKVFRSACEKVSRQLFLRDASATKLKTENQSPTRVDMRKRVVTKTDEHPVGAEDDLNSFNRPMPPESVVKLVLRRLGVKDMGEMQIPASLGQIVDLLVPYQVSAVVTAAGSLEDLALLLSGERTVILTVNAGELWEDERFLDGGVTNHLLLPIECHRSPLTEEIEGFVVLDPGIPGKPFVPATRLSECWLKSGGFFLKARRENLF